MKLQELNQQELTEINGGGLFGNSDSSSSNGLLGKIGIGSLLSFQTATKDGDQQSASSFSLGDGISLDLGGLFNNANS
ncbi:hypothetical protein [Pedobacter metabolipauper]|uniref:Bacteriocin-like protein n=1 Tax=Pedobacter metabolipauper TaxID=425513 RepID=A0A4R6T038_9SPHI|nr:hypothetical protein [Pedobacter metabolipauper]TDQ10918.1 hypothetical protein ATK78_0026 [Pedobacter metabolipauper]